MIPVRQDNSPHDAVANVRDIKIPRAIKRDLLRITQFRARCLPAVSRIIAHARRARHGVHRSTSSNDFAHHAVVLIGKIKIAGSVHRRADRFIQQRRGRQRTVGRKSRRIIPGENGHGRCRCPSGHLIDDAVVVYYIKIPRGISNHCLRSLDRRSRGRNVVGRCAAGDGRDGVLCASGIRKQQQDR